MTKDELKEYACPVCKKYDKVVYHGNDLYFCSRCRSSFRKK